MTLRSLCNQDKSVEICIAPVMQDNHMPAANARRLHIPAFSQTTEADYGGVSGVLHLEHTICFRVDWTNTILYLEVF